MTDNNTPETTPVVEEAPTAITPYAAHKLVNKALETAGLTYRIPPQMMYNYTTTRINAGKAPMIECDKDGKIIVAKLGEWIEKYVAKKTPAPAKIEEAEADDNAKETVNA